MTRRQQRQATRLITLIILLIIAWLAGERTILAPSPSVPASTIPAPAGSLSLVTEPNAGIQPVLQLIGSAKKSVDLVMYELEDPQVEQALAIAKSRGVSVRVLLNGGYYGKPDGSNPNQAAYNFLQAQGVPVRWTPSSFALTHQKTLAIDGQAAFIMTFNLTPQYYASSRDFGIRDTDAHDVAAIEETFAADWQNQKLTATSGDDLLWSPGSEAASIALINQAKQSLHIYNEEMADSKVVSALGAAAMRGVDVELVMTDSSEWHANFNMLTRDGVHVRTFAAKAPLYIHAKMIVADGRQAFVGSENFSVGSLTRNRELGIILADKSIISQLDTTFSADYQNATIY